MAPEMLSGANQLRTSCEFVELVTENVFEQPCSEQSGQVIIAEPLLWGCV